MPVERRGLGSRETLEVTKDRGDCSTPEWEPGLGTPVSVRKLQKALHAKAKGSPSNRFYTLYDKVYRTDVLRIAYERCRSNGGAEGVDGQTFGHIEAYGRERWLGELAQELREKTYRPTAVRRVWIPKPGGKQRPLGIPTIKDRAAQIAAVLVLEPILEADLQPEQYAYRSGRSAHDAIRHVHRLLNTGHREVVDADLSGYFDSIPHPELMKSVARRISDGAMLRLVKMWLEAPIEETDERGRRRRRTRNKDEKRGTPQGAPISPLLSNLYMRRFILGWKILGYERRLDAHIVNYADDFVICCRNKSQEAMIAMRRIMDKLKLTVNEQKTRRIRIPEQTFEFLGHTIGRMWSPRTGRSYIGTRPAKEKISRLCRQISEETSRRWLWREVDEQVEILNRKLLGWANYFCLGAVSRPYDVIDRHVSVRLRRWLRLKHKVSGKGTSRYPDEYLYQTLGLVRLEVTTRNLPWAKA